jgi:C4-dicarboxylate transporter DctQ subunit
MLKMSVKRQGKEDIGKTGSLNSMTAKEAHHLTSFLKKLDEHLEEYLLGILLLLLTTVMFTQVVMRYVFGSSLSWVEEFCRYIFIYTTFLTIGYCIKRGSMLRVDLLLQYLPKIGRLLLDLIIQMISLMLFSVLFYYSFKLVAVIASSNQLSPAMQIPFAAIYFSTIIGFGLAVFRCVQRIVMLITELNNERRKRGEPAR